ncbi:MAG TPA: LysM domain-containing protein, partial [Rhodoferax sp.]
SSLLVPRPTELVADVAEHVADNGQLSLAPDAILKRNVLKAGKKDSVASLARRYRVSPASVAEWNKVSASAVFKAGQQVVMFLPVRAKTLVQSKTLGKTKSTSTQARSKVRKPTRLAKQP